MPTVTQLVASFDDADVNSASSRIISMAGTSWGSASRGLIVLANRQGSGTPASPTITGGWSSWSVHTTRAVGTVSGACIAVGSGTSTDAQDISVFYGTTSSLAVTYGVYGLSNVPSTPIGLASNGAGTGTTGTATLAGTPTAGSTIAVWFTANAGTAFAADTNWTELGEPNSLTPVLNSVLATNTVLDQTYLGSWGSSIAYGWIIFEILDAPTDRAHVPNSFPTMAAISRPDNW